MLGMGYTEYPGVRNPKSSPLREDQGLLDTEVEGAPLLEFGSLSSDPSSALNKCRLILD